VGIVLGPNRAYPSIPSVSGDLENHTVVLQAIREALEIHERRTRNVGDSFVRLSELDQLGLVNIDLTADTGSSTVVETDDDDASFIRRDGTSEPTTGEIDFGSTGIKFLDSSENDSASMFHDGTDFNIEFVNTTDWNISGLTALNLPNNFDIDWATQADADVTMLNFGSGGASGGTPIDYSLSVLATTESKTGDTNYYEITGMSLTDLTVGDQYLLFARPLVNNFSSGNTLQNWRLKDNGVLIPRSDVRFESSSPSTGFGFTMGFSRRITVAGDITCEMNVETSGQTVRCFDQSYLFALNLDELGADNYEYVESTATYQVQVLNTWEETGVSLAFGDGVKNYLVFACVRVDGVDVIRPVDFRLNNGTTTQRLFSHVPQDGNEFQTLACFLVMTAPSGTYNLEIFQSSFLSSGNQIDFASICAIDLDAFEEVMLGVTALSTIPGTAAPNTLASFSETKTGTGTMLALESFVGDDDGTTNVNVLTDLVYQVDGGSDVTLATAKAQVFNASGEAQPINRIGVTNSIADGATVTAQTREDGDWANHDLYASSILFLTMNTSSVPDEFNVGNAAYQTNIFGTNVDIEASLDVTGAAILESTLNVVGAVDLDSTLNVDGNSTLVGTLDVSGVVEIAPAGAGPWLSLGATAAADGDILLKFDIDRPWDVIQRGDGATAALAFRPEVDSKYIQIEGQTGEVVFRVFASDTLANRAVEVRNGSDFRIYDDGDTDFAEFNHDGTDFTAAFTNTVDWNVTGLTALSVESGKLRAGTQAATSGASAVDIPYTGSNVLNTFGALRASGATVVGFGVRPDEATNRGYESSAGNASFARTAFELEQLGFKWKTAAAATVAIGTDVTMTEVMSLDLDGNLAAAGYMQVGVFTDANRGAAGTAGRIIFNSDDGQLNIDDGTNWTLPDGTTT
jgi:hypothetical protein